MYATGQKFTGIVTIITGSISILFSVLSLIAVIMMGWYDGMYSLLWWMLVVTILILAVSAVSIVFASILLKGGYQPRTAITILVAQVIIVGLSITSNVLDAQISGGESSSFLLWIGYIVGGIIIVFAGLHAMGKGFPVQSQVKK